MTREEDATIAAAFAVRVAKAKATRAANKAAKLAGESDASLLVYDVPEAGKKVGLNRGQAYAAAKKGELPTVRFGRLLKVPKKAFHEKFGEPNAAGA
jgi:hypothetical protein